MAGSIHLLLAVVLCSALQYTAATDQSLECYHCTGYNADEAEDPIMNNKDCAEGSFNSKTIQTIINKVPEGDIKLQCVVVTVIDGYYNSGRSTTFRMAHNYTRHHPSTIMDELAAGLGAEKDAPTDNGEMHMTWCSTALCNGAAGGAHLALATLITALALYSLH